jgi:hypothetical protein
MGGGKNFLVSAAGFSILGNGIFWWKAKTKRLFSQGRVRTMISVVLAVCLLILIKKIYHQIRK